MGLVWPGLGGCRAPDMEIPVAYVMGGDSSDLVRRLFFALTAKLENIVIPDEPMPAACEEKKEEDVPYSKTRLKVKPDSDWHCSAALMGQKGPSSNYPYVDVVVTRKDGDTYFAEYLSKQNVHRYMQKLLSKTDNLKGHFAESPHDLAIDNGSFFVNGACPLCLHFSARADYPNP